MKQLYTKKKYSLPAPSSISSSDVAVGWSLYSHSHVHTTCPIYMVFGHCVFDGTGSYHVHVPNVISPFRSVERPSHHSF